MPGSPGATGFPGLACAQESLATLAEPQLVGQLFAFGLAGSDLTAADSAVLTTYHLGSVWLVNSRTGGVAGVRALSDEVQALATQGDTGGVGFFIGADQEGGLVQRLTGPGFSTIPTAVAQGRSPVATLREQAAEWGRELAAAGVNLDLAPVADVVPPADVGTNQPIGVLDREYGGDPETVGSHVAAVVEGLGRSGVATTLKHFPGLGRVAGNTDTVAGVHDDVTTASDPDLAAFGAGIDAGAPLVMVSLAYYSQIDPGTMAVFSAAIIGNLLRGRLGFAGVVVSDDLGATKAVAAVSPADRAIDFIEAGGNLVLVQGASVAGQMASAVAARAAADASFGRLVSESALRVLEAKARLGLLRCG